MAIGSAIERGSLICVYDGMPMLGYVSKVSIIPVRWGRHLGELHHRS